MSPDPSRRMVVKESQCDSLHKNLRYLLYSKYRPYFEYRDFESGWIRTAVAGKQLYNGLLHNS